MLGAGHFFAASQKRFEIQILRLTEGDCIH